MQISIPPHALLPSFSFQCHWHTCSLHFNPDRPHTQECQLHYMGRISLGPVSRTLWPFISWGDISWFLGMVSPLQNWVCSGGSQGLISLLDGRASPPLHPPSPLLHPLTSMAIPCNGASNHCWLQPDWMSPSNIISVKWFSNCKVVYKGRFSEQLTSHWPEKLAVGRWSCD